MIKKHFAVIIALVLIITTFSVIGIPAFADNDENSGTVVVFTSDVHHISVNDDYSANRLKLFLEHVISEYGTVDAVGICGDIAKHNNNTSVYWSYADRVIQNVDSLNISGIYTTGNHEHEDGSFSTVSNSTTARYTRLGLGRSTDNYEIYCMGAASTTLEFPDSDITALSNYLETVGTEKPVFVLSHYPLHSFTYKEGKTYITRDPVNRIKLIILLNQYPNVYFLWGHNHSKNDPNYNKIITDAIGDTAINFTYAGAGSMTESSENYYAGNITSKGLVTTISKDGKLVSLRFLDKNYDIVGSVKIITTPVSEPTEASFAAACYDNTGKMLGVTMVTKTIDGNSTSFNLDYPSGVSISDISQIKVMAMDSDYFTPVSQPLVL